MTGAHVQSAVDGRRPSATVLPLPESMECVGDTVATLSGEAHVEPGPGGFTDALMCVELLPDCCDAVVGRRSERGRASVSRGE